MSREDISLFSCYGMRGAGKSYYEKMKEKDKEIERLNNIIKELEKWLEEQHQFIIEIPAFTKEISIEHKTMELCYENILDKLQELKGSDKE